jgi:RNA polymerase sigma-70 factor (ECF subfamily)
VAFIFPRRRPSETPRPPTVEDVPFDTLARTDQEAFAAVYGRHFAGIYGYCYRELGSAERAEDATQQVFAQALGSLPRYEEQGRFRSWLYAIAYHVIHGQISADHHDGSLDDVEGLADPGSSPEEQVLGALDRRALLEAIARLPRDQRRVVELRIAGLKGREIAAELGRSHEAVRMLQHRALDQLAALMSPDQSRGGQHGA